MNCTRTDREGESRIQLEGSLDALTAPEIRPIFDKLVAEKRPRVVLDLQNVTMIDSSGVGAMVSLFKRIKAEGGVVTVANAHSQPLSVLKLLKLDKVFGL
ncbi:MAG: STAS domain-containing protein [Labilithrix sp.]|nr:STAS domain-containing protein [Labilithrix sp.]MCW5811261.1 STAS domain-containing protein [Labilithrix sp.]